MRQLNVLRDNPDELGRRKLLEEQGPCARNWKDCSEKFDTVENRRRRENNLLKKLIM